MHTQKWLKEFFTLFKCSKRMRQRRDCTQHGKCTVFTWANKIDGGNKSFGNMTLSSQQTHLNGLRIYYSIGMFIAYTKFSSLRVITCWTLNDETLAVCWPFFFFLLLLLLRFFVFLLYFFPFVSFASASSSSLCFLNFIEFAIVAFAAMLSGWLRVYWWMCTYIIYVSHSVWTYGIRCFKWNGTYRKHDSEHM